MNQPKNDSLLAEILGTNRKCLTRARNNFPASCPKDRDPVKWQSFLSENLLGPYSAMRNYGDSNAAVAELKRKALGAVILAPQENPHSVVHDTQKALAALVDFYDAGELSRAEYFHLAGEIAETFAGRIRAQAEG